MNRTLVPGERERAAVRAGRDSEKALILLHVRTNLS
jgi:hypothetical protein